MRPELEDSWDGAEYRALEKALLDYPSRSPLQLRHLLHVRFKAVEKGVT